MAASSSQSATTPDELFLGQLQERAASTQSVGCKRALMAFKQIFQVFSERELTQTEEGEAISDLLHPLLGMSDPELYDMVATFIKIMDAHTAFYIAARFAPQHLLKSLRETMENDVNQMLCDLTKRLRVDPYIVSKCRALATNVWEHYKSDMSISAHTLSFMEKIREAHGQWNTTQAAFISTH